MRIAGVDYSTRRIDVVTLPWEGEAEPVWRYLDLQPDLDVFRLTRQVRERLPFSVAWVDVELVYVEKPYSQNRRTLAALSVIQGAIGASLPPHHMELNEITAQIWKQVFCDKANASKDEVKAAGLARGFGYPELPQDAFDAYGIAWAAREENRRGIAVAEAASA